MGREVSAHSISKRNSLIVMEKVYILILNWNNWKDTIQCIQSLYHQPYQEFQIILADNDSSDGSVEKIVEYLNTPFLTGSSIPYYIFREEQMESTDFIFSPYRVKQSSVYPVMVVRNKKNHGFGKGNNVGIRLFLGLNDSSYLWLLNNDTTVDERALTELVSEAKKSDEFGVVGSVLIYQNLPDKIQTIGGGIFYPLLGLSKLVKKNKSVNILSNFNTLDFQPKLSYIMGASMLIKRSVFEKVGLFDEDYFLYSEELDLCHRIKKAGFKLRTSLQSKVFHKESVSTKDKKFLYFYLLTKGNTIFLKKHFSFYFQICSLIPVMFSTLKNTRDWKNLKYAFKGFLDGFRFKSGVSKS